MAKILVVDDEDRNLRLMEAMLTPLGYEVILARDGEEALEKVREIPPDVILLDIMMPRMDGFEVARRLKDDEEIKIIPIVMVTSLKEVEDRVRALEVGADDFLTKPVDRTELKARIQSLLKVKAYQDHMRNYQKELEAEVARRTEQIKASLKEKEVLLKEIHHRVKNNLQVIISLLNLQSGHITDKQVLEMFKEGQNRIMVMALIHEKLYQSKDLARINFAEYVRNLVPGLFHSYGVNSDVVALKVNADDVSLGVYTAVPCGLIINELVSNSLKHAFLKRQAGEICISLHSDNEGRVTLVVSDNGVGFPKDLDFRNTESLGLQLVNTLTSQLEGDIELDRSGGTAFKITFAEPKY